jgi:ferredoxin
LPHNPAFTPVFKALEERQFFKLICGGSFSDPERLKQLIAIYAETGGVAAIDVSAAQDVVEAAIEALQGQKNPPLLMVSFPLDNDPHFRKIELLEPDCIDCGACIPVCPTQVFSMPTGESLKLDVPVCYGCGRCLPVCPTSALILDPFSVHPDLAHVLAMPEVGAVEIHTTYADPMMVKTLYDELGPLLKNKLISLCLRPQTLPLEQVMAFIETLKTRTPYPMIIQVDGIPMSGSDAPDASFSALESAKAFSLHLPESCYLTISGGINAFTAEYLEDPQYKTIRGVGMGTYARRQVWEQLSNKAEAIQIAESLVNLFLVRQTSAIMKV